MEQIAKYFHKNGLSQITAGILRKNPLVESLVLDYIKIAGIEPGRGVPQETRRIKKLAENVNNCLKLEDPNKTG